MRTPQKVTAIVATVVGGVLVLFVIGRLLLGDPKDPANIVSTPAVEPLSTSLLNHESNPVPMSESLRLPTEFAPTPFVVKPVFQGMYYNLARPATVGRIVLGMEPISATGQAEFGPKPQGSFRQTGAWKAECGGRALVVWAGAIAGSPDSSADGAYIVQQTFDLVGQTPLSEPELIRIQGVIGLAEIVDGNSKSVTVYADRRFFLYDIAAETVQEAGFGVAQWKTNSTEYTFVEEKSSGSSEMQITSYVSFPGADGESIRIFGGSTYRASDGSILGAVARTSGASSAQLTEDARIVYPTDIEVHSRLEVFDRRGDWLILREQYGFGIAILDLDTLQLAMPSYTGGLRAYFGLTSPIWGRDRKMLTAGDDQIPFPTEAPEEVSTGCD